mgnify:CR=1 FL=1
MKRSTVNEAVRNATHFFEKNGWHLPPKPKWDVTDFGLGDFKNKGLVLINLAEEVEYCEKLMYAIKGQTTPAHAHKKKKEDIICRTGMLVVKLWKTHPEETKSDDTFEMKLTGEWKMLRSGDEVTLHAGERITIQQGIYHEFYPSTEECIIGEVSTANDDLHDNFFVDDNIGRFSEMVEDEPALVKLVSD